MNNERSRIDRYNKRRKNRRMISILLVLGSILMILLISVLLLDNKNDKQIASKEKGKDAQAEAKEDIIINEQTEEDEIQSDNQDGVEDLEIVTVESSDANVLEAFKAEWEPIGTSQSEPHTVDYNSNSKDREEMKKAIQLATGLDDMTIWWIGNDGEQKVVSTVSPMDESKTYRVYLSWEENRGWQPTLVEVLKENDKPQL